MPRTRKRTKTPVKKGDTAIDDSSVDNEEPSEVIGSDSQTNVQVQEPESEVKEKNIPEDVNMTEDEQPPAAVELSNEDVEGNVSKDADPAMEVTDEQKQSNVDDQDVSKEETDQKKDQVEEEAKPQKQIKKKEPERLYRPHDIPSFCNKSLIEKWEWHLKIFPIDQADIRSCILESVSKIAQETWMYIDKRNYGMGSYDLCVKSPNDAAMIMLKTLAMPLMYRYITVEITRRGQNQEEVKKAAEASDDDDADDVPYSEILETATLLLDFLHTPVIEKVKGQEKKRSLYVKYLPEGTTKEFLKVLFPVANNSDIITTGEGRRVGVLNVSTIPNIIGICNAYVSVHVKQTKTITLDWNEDNLDDGILQSEAFDELPWEILPRAFEYAYETVPEILEDDHIEYAKRRRNLEETLLRHDPKTRDRGQDRDRQWGGSGRGRGGGEVSNVLQMQLDMNEKINSQIAFLHAMDDVTRSGAGPSILGKPPPLMALPVGEMGFRGRDDRRDGRGDRDRRNSSGGRRSSDGRTRRDSKGDRRRDREGRPSRWDNDSPSRSEKEKGRPERDRSSGKESRWEDKERDEQKRKSVDQEKAEVSEPFEKRGDRFGSRGPGRFEPPGRGGRFDNEGRGGRFGGDKRRGGGGGFFEMEGRGGRFESDRRRGSGRGGMMDDRGRDQFSSFGGGAPFEPMEMGRGGFGFRGRGRMDGGRGRFDDHGRGNRFDDSGPGGRFDNSGPGGRFDNSGRGRHFEGKGRGGFFGGSGPAPFEERRPEGRFDNSSSKVPMAKDTSTRGGLLDKAGRGGGSMRGGFSNTSAPRGNKDISGVQSKFGNQQKNPVYGGNTDQKKNFNQQGMVGTQNMTGGANPSSGGNVQNQQGNVNTKANFGDQGGWNNSSSYRSQTYNNQNKAADNSQGNMGTQAAVGTQGGFGTQVSNVTGQTGYGNQTGSANNQRGFGNQQNTNAQTGFGTGQNMNAQSGYRNQQNMMSNQGSYNDPQNSYTSQQTTGYNTQQGQSTTPAVNYGNNQQATNVGQGSYNSQQNTYSNQSTMNTQQNNYGVNQQQGNYGNQGYTGYSDNTYAQNYMGTQQQAYGNYNTGTTDNNTSQMWSQNMDYSQYGQTDYSTTQNNMSQAYSTTGAQATTNVAGIDNTVSAAAATGYNTQGANAMGYTADASYAAQGYYNTAQADTSTMNYGAYSTQDSTNSYANASNTNSYANASNTNATNATNATNLATYNFASYNTGTS